MDTSRGVKRGREEVVVVREMATAMRDVDPWKGFGDSRKQTLEYSSMQEIFL